MTPHTTPEQLPETEPQWRIDFRNKFVRAERDEYNMEDNAWLEADFEEVMDFIGELLYKKNQELHTLETKHRAELEMAFEKVRSLEVRGTQRYMSNSGFWTSRELISRPEVMEVLTTTTSERRSP